MPNLLNLSMEGHSEAALSIGQRVQISGLESSRGLLLNGHKGSIICSQSAATGPFRFGVLLDNSVQYSVKPHNLKCVDDSTSAEEPAVESSAVGKSQTATTPPPARRQSSSSSRTPGLRARLAEVEAELSHLRQEMVERTLVDTPHAMKCPITLQRMRSPGALSY